MKKTILLIILVIFCSIPLMSHPHMFFSNRYTIELENDQLQGLWVDWLFDPYFTQEILFDFDLDQNRIFSPAETKDVHDYAFINLANYGYFQLIRQGAQRYTVEEIQDFQVFLEDETLVYRFYVSLENIPAGDLWLATYDPTFFCAIDYAETPVLFNGDSQLIKYKLEENPDYPIYYDPLGAPTESRIYEEWEPGLQTFIPTEVHLWYE